MTFEKNCDKVIEPFKIPRKKPNLSPGTIDLINEYGVAFKCAYANAQHAIGMIATAHDNDSVVDASNDSDAITDDDEFETRIRLSEFK